MRHGTWLLLLLSMLAAPALAGPPADSPRPAPRPEVGAAPVPLEQQAQALARVAPSSLAPARSLLPAARPRIAGTLPTPELPTPEVPTPELPSQVVAAGVVTAAAVRPAPLSGLLSRLRPAPRPETAPAPLEEVQPAAAVRVEPGRSAVFGRKGSVCGVKGIRGETLAPITSRVRGCGIREPVRVTAVDGVALSMAATLDCPTAQALHDWVRGSLKPAFGRTGVAELQVAAHYACRPRNNVRGAPISEHGRGKAIDISAVVLENGRTVSVLDDWRNRNGRPLVRAYRGACGTFGTTLGPDADRFHRNHLHFDTARHGNGAYCR